MKEIFAQMQLNECTDEENFCTGELLTKIFLNASDLTNERLNKLMIFEQMLSIGQTTEQNYNTRTSAFAAL